MKNKKKNIDLINLFINLIFFKMKKIFYVAAAILAAGFVSCSDNNGEGTMQVPAEESATAILFNVGNGRVEIQQNAPATRGTGTVGDTIGTGNIWHGESLNVYMFKKDSLVLATENDGTTPIFENALVYAPDSKKDQTGVVYADYASTNGVKYYPMQGNYDFFAYRVDGAATSAPYYKMADNTDTDSLIVDVRINGTQDLMIAKATPDTLTVDSALRARCYSAYSARRGVQPHFKFEHLLSRLKFFATPNAKKDTIVRIEAIKVLGRDYEKANGMVVKAACTDAEFVISWTGDSISQLLGNLNNPTSADIALMQVDTAAINAGNDSVNVDLVALTPFAPVWNATADKGVKTQVGESMLLFPAESYVMEITLSQNIAKAGEPDSIITNKLYNELKLPVDAQGAPVSFKAGNQYHINFVVYGLEEIKLELELTPWNYVEGANDVEINDDVEF